MYLNSLAAFALLFFVTAASAKKGGSSSHSGGGGGSSSSPSSSSSSSGDEDDPYFTWNPDSLTEFILAIVFATFTLFGGGYWLWKRYNPATKAAGLVPLLWSTWCIWGITLLFYALAAGWAGSYAHAILGYYEGSVLSILQTLYARNAFEALCTVGWMFILLALTHTVGTRPTNETDHPRNTHFLFYTTVFFLALSALFGGIVRPAVMASMIYPATDALQVVYSLFAFIAACLLLATVLVSRNVTPSAENFNTVDPLRWVLFIATPLWIVAAFVRFVLADLLMAQVLFFPVIDPSLLLFGIASLATIIVLPSTIVAPTKISKELET